MSENISRRRRMKIVAGIAAATLVGGVAWAYWTAGGSGTGSAATAAGTTAVVIHQDPLVGSPAPGVTLPLKGTVTNPGPTAVKLGVITATVTPAVAGVSVIGTAFYSAPIVTNAAPVTWTGLSLQYLDNGLNQDAGKNQALTINYTMAPFVEPTTPPAAPGNTVSVTTIAGVPTLHVYVNGVTNTQPSGDTPVSILPGDTLTILDGTTNVWTGTLATADANGVITYQGPLVAGHLYFVTVNRGGTPLRAFTSFTA